MAKSVTLDTLALEGANIWIDPATGDIRLEVSYAVSSSASGVTVRKTREVQDMLTATQRQAILDLAASLKSALEQEELT